MNGFAALDICPRWRYGMNKAASDTPLLPQNILLCSVPLFGVYTKFGIDLLSI